MNAVLKQNQNGKSGFAVKDCAIIPRMGGVEAALTLRELRERMGTCTIECLYYHFCETLITPTFDYPEFRNDFAIWAAYTLRDRVLAERLAIINPYAFDDLEHLRYRVIEIIDERLSELHYIPSVHAGEEFIFMRAVTVVFDTGMKMHKPGDIVRCLPDMSLSSIYYHFIEARRRTPDRIDDFSFWMQFLDPKPDDLIETLQGVDFYFLSLAELKKVLTDTLRLRILRLPMLRSVPLLVAGTSSRS